MGAEAKLERACVQHAKAQGFMMPKWTSPGTRGVHDRLLFARGVIIPIEFKAGTAPLTPIQQAWHKRCDEQGVQHGVVRSFEQFVELCRRLYEAD